MSCSYLLSGFPSFCARKFLKFLLSRERNCEVTLLVAEQDQAAANQVLSQLGHPARQRVRVLEGEAHAIDFGLSAADYSALAGDVEIVLHLAQIRNPYLNHANAANVNIGSARELIEFGRVAKRLRKIVFLSSTWVAGDHSGTFLERDLDVRQNFKTETERSLATAEKMLRGSLGNLPLIVLRVSDIAGDEQAGEVDPDSMLYPAILLSLRAGQDLFLPSGLDELFVHFVPMGYVLEATHRIMQTDGALGRTFHLLGRDVLSARQAFELLRGAAAGSALRGSALTQLTRTLLATPQLGPRVAKPWVLRHWVGRRTTYETTNTEQLLAGSGIECKGFAEYAETMLTEVRSKLASSGEGPRT